MAQEEDRRVIKDFLAKEGAEFDYRLRIGRHRFGYRVDKSEKLVLVDAAWFK